MAVLFFGWAIGNHPLFLNEIFFFSHQFSPSKMPIFCNENHRFHKIPHWIAKNIHRILYEAILKRWDPYQEIRRKRNWNCFLFGGINKPPKCPNIVKMVILGANIYLQIKTNFMFFPSHFLIGYSPFQNGLLQYSMNIFRDSIRYFVKIGFHKKKIGIS